MSKSSSGAASSAARISVVSVKILSILSAGPRSTTELIAQGGFSTAAAFMNLKKLIANGAVASERAGRSVSYHLVDDAVAVSDSVPRGRKKGTKNKSVSAKKAAKRAPKGLLEDAGDSLSATLAAIAHRLLPVTDLDSKLNVLDELSRSLPREVAAVLVQIRADLAAHSEA